MLFTERTQWRLGLEGTCDRSADIYQALYDAEELNKLERIPQTPKASDSSLPKTPRQSAPGKGTPFFTRWRDFVCELSSTAPASLTTPPRKLSSAEIIRAIHSPTSAKDERAGRTSSPSSSRTSRQSHRRGGSGSSDYTY